MRCSSSTVHCFQTPPSQCHRKNQEEVAIRVLGVGVGKTKERHQGARGQSRAGAAGVRRSCAGVLFRWRCVQHQCTTGCSEPALCACRPHARMHRYPGQLGAAHATLCACPLAMSRSCLCHALCLRKHANMKTVPAGTLAAAECSNSA